MLEEKNNDDENLIPILSYVTKKKGKKKKNKKIKKLKKIKKKSLPIRTTFT